MMPTPAVAPRALSSASGEVLPLEDLLRDVFATARRGTVGILGPPGAGKSTALALLRERVGRARYVDDAERGMHVRDDALCVYTAESALRLEHLALLRLAPWGLDEAIEYLLALHPDRCRSVIARIDDTDFAHGLPALWVPILDRLAASDDVADVRAAVLLDMEGLGRFRPVRALRTAQTFVAQLRKDPSGALPRVPSARLVADAARLLAPRDSATLHGCLRGDMAPMAASLLCATGRTFEVPPGINLGKARLSGVDWTGSDLQLTDLRKAHLDRAGLVQAELSYCLAGGANFDRADLRGAHLHWFSAANASFARARLDRVLAARASFYAASMRGATLRGALLRCADLRAVDLRGAVLERANLSGARLGRARIHDTDFSRADLSRALAGEVRFDRAVLTGARLEGIRARACNLSGVRLAGADLHEAELQGSLLTAAQMPGARLHSARLTGARAGDVNWEGADLRDADLSHVDFHMGSSRSGRVDSPIASEGSRTGFYTDEYHEMHFKAPEEIRKANLRGADLRGAQIEGTDFYLVDLRDARYTRRQARILGRCGAILNSRAT